MELNEIKKHWDNLALKYSEDIKSTTKTPTIKQLEINALLNTINSILEYDVVNNVLEVGCGNGHNLTGLSRILNNIKFTGVDYSNEMILNALNIIKKEENDRINFIVGNILELDVNNSLDKEYDIVFTDRCLINLNSLELQLSGFKQLVNKTKQNGYIIIIENIIQTYKTQNECRELIGLEPRVPDKYNLFLDEYMFLDFAKNNMRLQLLETNDFGSLHDLILYILLPKINDNKIDYSHPLIKTTTEFLINSNSKLKNSFGAFGQNRLYLFKKIKY
ncbi:MAG: class I SAM-dependent methyltransferase [Candidatus Sericytochromatia bacterium]